MQLVNIKSDNATLSSFLYSFDNVGNRVGVTEANGDIITWSYDGAYQLIREQRSGANAYDISYSYDGAGNRLTKEEGGVIATYSYDAANQLLGKPGDRKPGDSNLVIDSLATWHYL